MTTYDKLTVEEAAEYLASTYVIDPWCRPTIKGDAVEIIQAQRQQELSKWRDVLWAAKDWQSTWSRDGLTDKVQLKQGYLYDQLKKIPQEDWDELLGVG